MNKLIAIAAASVFILTSCQTSSNMMRGDDQTLLSLSDQRKANQTIKVVKKAPNGRALMGTVNASRCHRSFIENEPSHNMLMADLKAVAFGRGANYMTNIKIEKKAGLLQNCWYILDGSADIY